MHYENDEKDKPDSATKPSLRDKNMGDNVYEPEYKKIFVQFTAVMVDREKKTASPGEGSIVVDFNKPFADVADVRELERIVAAKMSLEMQIEFANIKIKQWQRME